MGTSQSSKGPQGAVPLVPPWVPDLPVAPGADTSPNTPPDEQSTNPETTNDTVAPVANVGIPVAPAQRFSGARRNIGEFFHSGNSAAMRRGIGEYVRKGYGGKAYAARRLGGTAQTAGALYNALAPAADRQPGQPGVNLDRQVLAGRPARDVIDAIIEAVRPVDGTQDAEASRMAVSDALSQLLERFPDADLLSLSQEELRFVIERFVSKDVFQRLELDIGQGVHEKAPTAVAALDRLKQMRDYIRETVAAAFRRMYDAGTTLTNGTVGRIIRTALLDAMEVFEVAAT